MSAADETGSSGTDTGEGASTTHKVARWRRILCGILVVVVCVLVPVSILAVWTRNTLLNTDQYVETVGPLARDAAIQDAVANRVVRVLTDNVDLEKQVKDALPERAGFVAPFVAQGIERFARDATLRILESDRFQRLWDSANRRAHAQVVAVLTGNEGGRITTKNGQVVVQLGPVVETVREQLSNLGIDVFSDAQAERASQGLVLFQSEDLTTIQGAVDLLDEIAYVLPFLLIALLVIAIALSGNRRRTVLRAAIGIAIATALLLIVFNLLRTVYLDAVTARGVDQDAAGAAYDQILEFLRLSTRTAFAVAVVVAIGAWLAGPGRYATRIREGVKVIAGGEGAPGVEATSTSRFVTRYKMPLRVVVVGVALVVLMVLSQVTPLTVLVIAVIVVVGLLLLEFLGRGGDPETPGPSAAAKETGRAATAGKSAKRTS